MACYRCCIEASGKRAPDRSGDSGCRRFPVLSGGTGSVAGAARCDGALAEGCVGQSGRAVVSPRQSGNSAGRRRGSRNHELPAAEVLLEGWAEALTRKASEPDGADGPRTASVCQVGHAVPTKGTIHDAGYDNRAGFGQAGFPGAWGRRRRRGGVAPPAQAPPDGAVFHQTAELFDWHGGVRDGASLGAHAAGSWKKPQWVRAKSLAVMCPAFVVRWHTAGPGGNRKVGMSRSGSRDQGPMPSPGLSRLVGRPHLSAAGAGSADRPVIRGGDSRPSEGYRRCAAAYGRRDCRLQRLGEQHLQPSFPFPVRLA